MSSDSPLFTPIRLGDIQLEHRLAMAPLTRFRATEEHVHTDMAVEYYSQRCDTPGTLIITEAYVLSLLPSSLLLTLRTGPSSRPRLEATRTSLGSGTRTRSLRGRRLLTPSTPRAARWSCKSPSLSPGTNPANSLSSHRQLWALGRASVEAQLTKEGPYPVVSSSTVGLTPDQESVPGSGTPVALSEAEIKEYVGWYAQAAKNFVEGAGGDGVEIHSANG